MKQTHSSVLKMRNPRTSSIRSSGLDTKPIACFLRGGPSARVELLAQHISTKSQNWGTTFGMFRCFFRTENHCTDAEYDIPTYDCLATTGTSMFRESKEYIGPRLPPRTTVQGHGRNKEIVVIHIEQSDEFRGVFPKSSNNSLLEFDSRHVTRADLPYATIGVFHIHPSINQPWSSTGRFSKQNHAARDIVSMRCDHRRRQQVREHLQQTPTGLQSGQRSHEYPHEGIPEIVE